MTDTIKERRMALIGEVLCIAMPPGEKVFNLYTGELIGIVMSGVPVVNIEARTAYLSNDDYDAAKAALPPAVKKLPGLH